MLPVFPSSAAPPSLDELMDDDVAAAPDERHQADDAAAADCLFDRLLQSQGVNSSASCVSLPLLLPSASGLRLYLDYDLAPASDKSRLFLQQLQDRCTDVRQLRRFMLPAVNAASASSSSSLSSAAAAAFPCLPLSSSPAPPLSSSSLLQVLVSVQSLQSSVCDWLLKTLSCEAADWLRAEGVDAERGSSLPPSSLCRLLLLQLRYLDVVYDTSHLAETAVDALQSAPLLVQRELIALLPSIIDSLHHERIALQLIAWLEEGGGGSNTLDLPILDALSNMHTPQQVVDRTVSSVTAKLPSARPDELPVLIRFLLRACNGDNTASILACIRTHVSLLGLDQQQAAGAAGAGKGEKEEKKLDRADEQQQSGPLLILRALKAGLQADASFSISKAYLELLSDVSSAAQHQELDVLLLLLVMQCGQADRTGKRAASLVCRKVADSTLTSRFIVSVLRHRVSCLQLLFDTASSLAESMVRSGDSRVRAVGGDMQRAMFESFSSQRERRLIVSHWLQHCGSRNAQELDSALLSMRLVAERLPAAMKPFYSLLKTTLQYLDDYTLQQIRQLFQLLAILAVEREAEEREQRQDDEHLPQPHPHSHSQQQLIVETGLMIFIRKELYAPSFRDRRIGIVAVIAVMERLAPCTQLHHRSSVLSPSQRPQHARDSSSSSTGGLLSSSLPATILSKLSELFEQLRKSVTESFLHDPAAVVFLYDELSFCLSSRSLHPVLLQQLISRYTAGFEPLLAVDLDRPKAELDELLQCGEEDATEEVELQYGIGTDEEEKDHSSRSIAVNITPALSASRSGSHQLYMMPAELRLLAAAELAAKGSMADIDSLLVAPLALITRSGSLSDFKQRSDRSRLLVISSLFHSINWLRELLNGWTAAAGAGGVDSVSRVMQRLQLMMELEAELLLYVNSLPGFSSQQLLGMGETASAGFMREMGRLEGSVKWEDESQQYTNIGRRATQQKKPQTKKRKRRPDSDDSGDGSDSDREGEQRKRKAKKQKQTAKKGEQKEEEVRHYDRTIRPFLRPLSISVLRLLCQPLPQPLSSTANDAERKQGGEEETTEEAEARSRVEREIAPRRPMPSLSLGLSQQSVRIEPTLSPSSLLYLLLDLCSKLKAVLSSRSSSNVAFFAASRKPASSLLQALHSPDSLLRELLPVLPHIHTHFAISAFLVTAEEEEEAVDREQLVACIMRLVDIVRIITACPALRTAEHRPLLQEALAALLGPSQDSHGVGISTASLLSGPLLRVCTGLLRMLESALPSLRSLDQAVSVLQVMQQMLELAGQQQEAEARTLAQWQERLSELAGDQLEQQFPSAVSFKKSNVGALLSLHVHSAAQPLKLIAEIAKDVSAVVKEEERQRCFFTETLTQKTAPHFILPLLDELVLQLRAVKISASASVSASAAMAQLTSLNLLCWSMRALVELTRLYPKRFSLHAAALRQSRQFVDRMARLLPLLLSTKGRAQPQQQQRQQTLCLLQSVQHVTRSLHVLLDNGKQRAVSAVIRLEPAVKKTLDAFIFAVKQLSKQSGLAAAFQQGELQQRTMDGNIRRQPRSRGDEDDEDEDDDDDDAGSGDGSDGSEEEARPRRAKQAKAVPQSRRRTLPARRGADSDNDGDEGGDSRGAERDAASGGSGSDAE